MSQVKLISVTPDAEKLIVYCARVSSKNQDNPDIEKLLRYCLNKGHWSIFEQASMTVEVKCPLAIATQITRHRSFCFQMFSQRYQQVTENCFYYPEIRLQDSQNRQNSIEIDENDALQKEYDQKIGFLYEQIKELYEEMLDKGIAKEVARFILPQSTMTRLYMTGNVRSWIHYLKARKAPETQKEHQSIAFQIDVIFKKEFPTIWGILNPPLNYPKNTPEKIQLALEEGLEPGKED